MTEFLWVCVGLNLGMSVWNGTSKRWGMMVFGLVIAIVCVVAALR